MPPIPPRPNFEVLSRPATKPFSRSESAILRAFEELDDLKDKLSTVARSCRDGTCGCLPATSCRVRDTERTARRIQK